jgi:hypothetical protein
MKEPLNVITRLARAGYREIHFRGLELTSDLIDESIWSVLSIALGNRRLTPEQSRVINALVVVSAVGDPRIWPLKVARLVASYGHPFAATAAGASFLDEIPLGPWAMRLAGDFLADAMARTSNLAQPTEALEAARAIANERKPVPGFGVAGREEDERYVAFAEWFPQQSVEPGDHWRLLLRLADSLEPEFGMRPNIAGAFAAVGLDFGLDPLEIALFTLASAHWATMANAREGLRESPELLRRLPDEYVEYVGPAPRLSPRAQAAAEEE